VTPGAQTIFTVLEEAPHRERQRQVRLQPAELLRVRGPTGDRLGDVHLDPRGGRHLADHRRGARAHADDRPGGVDLLDVHARRLACGVHLGLNPLPFRGPVIRRAP
jgi:hypothetical protein